MAAPHPVPPPLPPMPAGAARPRIAKYHRKITTALQWTCADKQQDIYTAILPGSGEQLIANGDPGFRDATRWDIRIDHKNRVYYVSDEFESTTWTHPNKVKRIANPPDLQVMCETIFEPRYFNDTTAIAGKANRNRLHNDIINDYMGAAPTYYDVMRHARNHALVFFVNHLVRECELCDPRFALAERESTMTDDFSIVHLNDETHIFMGNSEFQFYQKLWCPWVVRHNCKGAIIYVNTQDWSWSFQDPRIGSYGMDLDNVSGLPIQYKASFEWKRFQFMDLCNQAKGLRPNNGMPFDEIFWNCKAREERVESGQPKPAGDDCLFDQFYRQIMWWKVPEMKRLPRLSSNTTRVTIDEGAVTHNMLRNVVNEFLDPDFKYYLFKPCHGSKFKLDADDWDTQAQSFYPHTPTTGAQSGIVPGQSGAGDQLLDPSGLGNDYDTLILQNRNQVDEGDLWVSPQSTKLPSFTTQPNQPLPFGAARPEDQYTDQIYDELTVIDFEKAGNQLSNPGPQIAAAQHSTAKAAVQSRDENFRGANTFTTDERKKVTPPSAPKLCGDMTINVASYFWSDRQEWKDEECYKKYQFCGRLIGMCLFHGITLDKHFNKPLLKLLLSKESVELYDIVDDMKTIDAVLYNDKLRPLLERMDRIQNTDLVEYLPLLPWVEDEIVSLIDEDEKRKNVSISTILKPDFQNPSQAVEEEVTEAELDDYLKRTCLHHLYGKFLPQLQHFVAGFHEVVPRAWLHLFDERELDLLLCGVQTIDVDDWYQHSKVQRPVEGGGDQAYGARETVPAKDDQYGEWFFQYLKEMQATDPEGNMKLKALFFQVCDEGVPSGGFKNLAKGPFQICISRRPEEGRPAETDPHAELGQTMVCKNTIIIYRDKYVANWTYDDFKLLMENIIIDASGLYGLKQKNMAACLSTAFYTVQ